MRRGIRALLVASAILLAAGMAPLVPAAPEGLEIGHERTRDLGKSIAIPRQTPGPDGGVSLAPGLHEIHIRVGGHDALGHLAIPQHPSGTLVVIAKGFTWGIDAVDPELQHLAAAGHYALAMEYRGEVAAWKVEAAATDTVAATLEMQRTLPVKRTILYGYSMGGEASGMAVAMAPHGTFQVWITASGVSDLATMWAEVPVFQTAIEAETGGNPLHDPEAYRERSPIELAPQIAASGVNQVHILHGVADTVVAPEHALRLAQTLVTQGIDVQLHLIGVSPNAMVCVPGIIVCPTYLAIGPASHEAGWSPASFALLDEIAASR